MNEPLLKWSDKYLIGVENIDDQHKKLVETINTFNDNLNAQNSNQDELFREAVKEAVKFVKYHFSAEQELMEEIKYPLLNEQKQMHNAFITELLEEVKLYENGNKNIPHRLIRFLNDWFINHISVEDVKIGMYMKKQK